MKDGTIEFLGRLDSQVKIRGHRVELGEIEARLARHPGIEQCVVVLRGDSAETNRIIAYFIAKNGVAVTEQELRQYLSDTLPPYMLPSVFVPMNSFPTTANRKIDRKALPLPQLLAANAEASNAACAVA